MHSYRSAHYPCQREVAELSLPLYGTVPVLASPHRSRLANASWPNRVQHCFVYRLVFRFRLLSTLFLNDAVTVSYEQASVPVRKGLPPFCWCVLSGALL